MLGYKNSHCFWVNGMSLHTAMQELIQSLRDLTVITAPCFFGGTYKSYAHELERACVLYVYFAKLN